MNKVTVSLLRQLNRTFYDEHGPSFSVTRAQVQPGVQKLLPVMILQPKILDLGCGNGTLAEALALSNYEGDYLGLDGSNSLLGFAVERLQTYPRMVAKFQHSDLLDESLAEQLAGQRFSLLTCFATLQHLPSRESHKEFFRNVAQLLEPGGQLMLSCWQIRNSKRLTKHILDWSMLGLSVDDLEAGDLLMDWRGQDSQNLGLRYVHEFRQDELESLGEAAGLVLEGTFYSDGAEGNLALYQTWSKSEDNRE